ncbi:hypothetical protein [Enterobacter cloacae]
MPASFLLSAPPALTVTDSHGLSGTVLHTRGVDNGTAVALNDAAC